MISGGVAVNMDVPPFVVVFGGHFSSGAVAQGVNSIGLRRANLKLETRSCIKKIFKVFYLSKNTHTVSLELIQKEILNTLKPKTEEYSQVKYFIDFIKNSKRGIVGYAARRTKI